jgi:hypothetical protein
MEYVKLPIKEKEKIKTSTQFIKKEFENVEDLQEFRKTHHCMSIEVFRTKLENGTYSEKKYRTHEVIESKIVFKYKYIEIYRIISDFQDDETEDYITRTYLHLEDAQKDLQENQKIEIEEIKI